LVDTTLTFPMALDSAAFKKAGIDVTKLTTIPNTQTRSGIVPSLRLGAFDVPQVPGLHSDESVKEREDGLGIDIDGLIGSGLLATFRLTLVDGGRSMWLEDIPPEALVPPRITLQPIEDLPFDDEELEEDEPPAKQGVPKAPKGKKP
jgi:hypothetical protein